MTKAKTKDKREAGADRLASVTVQVDRALKQRWKTLSTEVQEAKREGASAFDRMWEAVAEIVDHDPPLYLAGGFATSKAYFAAELSEAERTARRNIRIARYASPDEEVRYGPSKLDAAITYVEAKAGGPVKGRVPVDFAKLRIPVAGESGARRLALAEATVDQIAGATRALLRQQGRSAAKASPLVKAITRELSSAALRGIKVKFAAGRLTLSAIPPESLAALGKALARTRPPSAG